ncbi:MAG: glycoside hydrolase family 127 protein, partial [Clostridia bacterium]|nr:glycoside hydrolase family 127 protein [Clostridia bacterium]
MKQMYTHPVSGKNVEIQPSFFKNLMNLAADHIIPYQWRALNDEVPDAAPSYCIRNFKAAAGEIDAPHGGFVFQDSDLAKWIEAASYMLMWRNDPETEKNIDFCVDLIEKAQLEDGYLDTYYILTGIDKRWTNIRDNHELYCAGHMLEAAVAYYRATGKRKLLDVMIRFVKHIYERFGTEEGKLRGYPGHEELELALVKLYEETGEEEHLKLAKYFIDERGQSPLFFDAEAEKDGRGPAWVRSVHERNLYYQAHKPVREQKEAKGHAVRACYLYSGMADVARETEDESLKAACETLYKNITRRQLYITGQVGQSAFGESFSFDYDLPGDLVYGETCASIALMFFAHRMLRMSPKGEYGDLMDKLIYNGTISGMNLEGDRFFYVNPLESWPERNKKNQQFAHVKSERQKWFGCACCPPNLARLVCSLPGYIYHTKGDTVYFALYTSSKADIALENGNTAFTVKTGYPWDGKVIVNVEKAFSGMTLALRLPAWVNTYKLNINGKYAKTHMVDGYLYIQDELKA